MLHMLRSAVDSGLERLGRQKKVEQRQLLIVVSFEDGKLYVLTAKDGQFHILPKERVRVKSFAILRKVWPLICDVNVVSTTSFIHHHIEYDVVKVRPCNVTAANGRFPMTESGEPEFGVVMLEQHPLREQIRRVLQK